MEPGTSPGGEIAGPHPHRMLMAAPPPPIQTVPDSFCEVLAEGKTGVTVATMSSVWDQ